MRFLSLPAVASFLTILHHDFAAGLDGNASALPPLVFPGLSLAFSGSVNVARRYPTVRIPGGVRVIEPISSGSFSGPLLNATIDGGLAFPTILANGTRQDAFITIYGTTSHNSTLLVQVSGTGNSSSQFADAIVEVNGPEAELMGEFLLTTIHPSEDGSKVAVGVYSVV